MAIRDPQTKVVTSLFLFLHIYEYQLDPERTSCGSPHTQSGLVCDLDGNDAGVDFRSVILLSRQMLHIVLEALARLHTNTHGLQHADDMAGILQNEFGVHCTGNVPQLETS